ncbi:acyl-CoA dehydrogenase [Naumannella sp. ID2617S]|uniref:Broad-specificity linear acyl-CoA dehydrogenase FadE5 n=1 Tax=Enemella dayhoffiae TaxID=2016507 RepID=A0A255GRY6_9ACTN|nr:acyl-CoA dehydrogenase [Enemella dayhoffiae]NNG20613.1 acyl-CoA dehydrogenase [Naumannella sp. ID2617S]OYO18597.1 acyl-CoA dehydrogenase [Enemella dayhoffiae]
MTHFKSNLRDITFDLFEVLDRDSVLGTGPAEDMDRETAEAVLTEMEHLCATRLAEPYAEGDRNPPIYDPQTRSVTMPESTKSAFKQYMDSDWWRLELPEELGGQDTPPSLRWAAMEQILGANPALYMYSAGPKFAQVVHVNGTERDKKIAQHMVNRQWGATMILTEPDAGSDVGAGRTRATLQADGTWHIEGVKRFITSGDQDMTENIMHLVLARPSGVEGVGGPGTKGLSLFLVPKYMFDLETGEVFTDQRNGVYATNVEKKMGLKVSATCEMTFGDGQPAVGWLLGEVHEGIVQMFQVIEHARMMVGTKAMATLSTGYLNALEYAKQRVQGADMLTPAKDAPRVTITHHPDVRRSLLTQKSTAEALRLLVLFTATFQDRVWIAESEGRRDEEAEGVNDLLLPIVKGYCSERAWTTLGTESLQTFGGSGFLQEYPIEQYVRDAKIDTLYEGTTAIQGQDLFFRKIIKDQGRAIGVLSKQIEEFLTGAGPLTRERELLGRAAQDVAQMIGTLTQLMMGAGEQPKDVYRVGLNTSRVLMALGDLVCAWLLVRAGEVASQRLEGASGDERDFLAGKVASAQWFCSTRLPQLTAERKMLESTTLDAMELPESAF